MSFQFLYAMRSLMFLLINLSILTITLETCPSNNTTYRKKRSLELPEGSSFVLTLQLLKAIQINEPSPINLALEFDVQWKIPNESKLFIKKMAKLRRQRRELYANFELALNRQNLPGNICILRSICESKLILNEKGVSFIEDILRIIFSYPSDSVSKLDKYDIAFRNNDECYVMYPCPFSILGLFLSYK